MPEPRATQGAVAEGESVDNEHVTESTHLRLTAESASERTLLRSLEEGAQEGGGVRLKCTGITVSHGHLGSFAENAHTADSRSALTRRNSRQKSGEGI